MQIEISGDNVAVTPPLRQRVHEKMEKLDHKYNNITHVNVVLKVENNMHQAEATVTMPPHGQIFASSNEKDMYESINRLEEKLSRQVTKHKEKLQDHHRQQDNNSGDQAHL